MACRRVRPLASFASLPHASFRFHRPPVLSEWKARMVCGSWWPRGRHAASASKSGGQSIAVFISLGEPALITHPYESIPKCSFFRGDECFNNIRRSAQDGGFQIRRLLPIRARPSSVVNLFLFLSSFYFPPSSFLFPPILSHRSGFPHRHRQVHA